MPSSGAVGGDTFDNQRRKINKKLQSIIVVGRIILHTQTTLSRARSRLLARLPVCARILCDYAPRVFMIGAFSVADQK